MTGTLEQGSPGMATANLMPTHRVTPGIFRPHYFGCGIAVFKIP
jgi:hypothetical protein